MNAALEGNGPGPAVEVPDGFTSCQARIFQGLGIESLRLLRVDLEKGIRRDAEGEVSYSVMDDLGAAQEVSLPTEKSIAAGRIYIEGKRGHARKFKETVRQGFPAGQAIAVYNRADHDFACGPALADQDVPDQALTGFFIIGFDGIGLHPGFDARNHGVAADGAQRTYGAGDRLRRFCRAVLRARRRAFAACFRRENIRLHVLHNPVTVGPVEAELDMAVCRPSYRELGLVAEEGWEG